uniref:Uncharacterized protein n=1 Tax=Tetranychus urticae TaxID=32264 RepID=T1KH36_TETUR
MCQSNLLFVSSLPLQVTSALPTLLTKVNSLIPHNFKTTEWSRIDKFEPRFLSICPVCEDKNKISFSERLFWDAVEQVFKARNIVVGTISRPLNWSTDTFFTGLETIYALGLRLFHKAREMFKSKCELDSSCERD